MLQALQLINENSTPTTLGYTLIGVAMFAAVLVTAFITTPEEDRKFHTKHLAYCALCIALAYVTSIIKLADMPMGGSITLFSMFFVCLIGYFYGPVIGILCGIAYGLLQALIDPYIISLPQFIVDYLLAFGALGISGFFNKQKHGLLTGYLAGIIGRFLFAVLSGIILFAQYAPENMDPLFYSATYNGSYIFTEAILTFIVLMVPPIQKLLQKAKTKALS